MAKIRLELDELALDRPKKRWNIYFVVATSHPSDDGQYAVTMLPQPIAPMRRPAGNVLDFVATGDGAEGLEVLERDMPSDRSIEVHCWAMHSRLATRRAGDILEDVGKALETDVSPLANGLLGSANAWVGVARTAVRSLGVVGSALISVRDRNLGFVNLGEQFGPEFERETELDRAGALSTGYGRLVWTWTAVD